MADRVRVRRERPTALSRALALAVTMLAVYLATLGAPEKEVDAEPALGGARVTREVTLQGVQMYFADLGVHADPLQARIAAADLASRGAAGVVRADASGHHVLGAAYELEADARRIAQRLTEQENLSAAVLPLSVDEVSLRITAPEGDIEAIVAADAALRAQLNQAASMALQMDRGELPAASARTLAAVSASELKNTKGRLQKVSGAEEHPVSAGLIAQLDALAQNLSETARSGDRAAALSGRLRSCHVSGMLNLIEWLDSLQ